MSAHRLEIRAAAPDDLDELVSLEQRAGDARWTRSQFEQEISGAPARLRVLRLDGRICGFGGYWKAADEAQVSNLVIAPEFQRLGLGQKLLSHLLEEARHEHCLKVTLEVRAGNVPALALYAANGFSEKGRRARFYQDPVDDAVLMEKTFESPTRP